MSEAFPLVFDAHGESVIETMVREGRHSELVGLNAAALEFCKGGLRVTIRKSKTDQEGMGAVIAITRGAMASPVDAVQTWIKAADISDGPLFRPVTRTGKISARRLSARAVAELVKVYARRAGLKAADFSGHPLRSGFLTSAAARGASIFKMMDVSRHKSIDTLRGYPHRLWPYVRMEMTHTSLLCLSACAINTGRWKQSSG